MTRKLTKPQKAMLAALDFDGAGASTAWLKRRAGLYPGHAYRVLRQLESEGFTTRRGLSWGPLTESGRSALTSGGGDE